jgi:hypothetical protein
MDTLQRRVFINLLYLTGGQKARYQMRPLPVPPPSDDPNFDPKSYPSDGGWPGYLRRSASHLLVPPALLAQPDYEVRGGETPSDLGELLSFPSTVTHHGVGPSSPEDRVLLFWFSYDKDVSIFFLYDIFLWGCSKTAF